MSPKVIFLKKVSPRQKYRHKKREPSRKTRTLWGRNFQVSVNDRSKNVYIYIYLFFYQYRLIRLFSSPVHSSHSQRRGPNLHGDHHWGTDGRHYTVGRGHFPHRVPTSAEKVFRQSVGGQERVGCRQRMSGHVVGQQLWHRWQLQGSGNGQFGQPSRRRRRRRSSGQLGERSSTWHGQADPAGLRTLPRAVSRAHPVLQLQHRRGRPQHGLWQ